MPGDPGAHGDFDQRSHGRSLQLMATKRRPALVAGLAGAGAAALAGLLRARG